VKKPATSEWQQVKRVPDPARPCSFSATLEAAAVES
jgi:hypothetical protein